MLGFIDELNAIWKGIMKKSTSELLSQVKSSFNVLLQRYPDFDRERKEEVERLLNNTNKESSNFKIWIEEK